MSDTGHVDTEKTPLGEEDKCQGINTTQTYRDDSFPFL